jgi:hypothetical protein
MSRVVKTKDELEQIVINHLRTRNASAGVASVVVAPLPGTSGEWMVKAFQEGSSSRAACLVGLHGILPVLQATFALGG